MDEKPMRLVRLDAEVMHLIEAAQRPRETYNDALRRLLALDRADGRTETPEETVRAS